MEEVKHILESWELAHLFAAFEGHKVDLEAFNSLNNEYIKELIPTLGDRIRFTKKFSEYQQLLSSTNEVHLERGNLEEKCNSTSSTSTASVSLIDFTEDKPLDVIPVAPANDEFDLKEFLSLSSEGREILKYSGNFTPIIRNKLTDLIIRNELKHDESRNITASRFVQLARSIKQTFPTENIGTYYSPFIHDQNKKIRRCANGKLVDKYHNRRRAMRAAGLLTRKRKYENEQGRTITSDEENELIKWLEHCLEPWVDVCEKWLKTFKARLNILKEIEDIQVYFNQFPCLNHPLGFTLIESDFKHVHEEFENKVFLRLPGIIGKIIIYAKKTRGDAVLQKILEENQDIVSEDHELALGLQVLPLLFAKTVLVKPQGKSKKLQWRPSKVEVQHSFVAHLQTISEVQPFLERRRNKYADLKESCQPVIIIVGKDLKSFETLISVNSTLYKAGSLLKSVDVTYKIFHVLNLKYPVECQHVWFFLQKYIYEMITPWDKSYTLVEQFFSDLNQTEATLP